MPPSSDDSIQKFNLNKVQDEEFVLMQGQPNDERKRPVNKLIYDEIINNHDGTVTGIAYSQEADGPGAAEFRVHGVKKAVDDYGYQVSYQYNFSRLDANSFEEKINEDAENRAQQGDERKEVETEGAPNWDNENLTIDLDFHLGVAGDEGTAYHVQFWI